MEHFCCFTSFSSFTLIAPKLIQCIKYSRFLTTGAKFDKLQRWELCEILHFESIPHSTSACARGTIFQFLDNCHTTWSKGNLHYMRLWVTNYRLHFLKRDQEFFCLLPSVAQLYHSAASPSPTFSIGWLIGNQTINL